MDRQFSEDEAREVFARAAERQHAVSARGAGLSLDELRQIGVEAGLDPEHVEAAARSVALGEPEQGRQAVGPFPRGVYRTAYLPGPPADALWEHLVADARRTFSAQGKVTEGGRVREWRNGNLRVSLEPAGDGSRLHLQTRRDDWLPLTAAAAVVAACALVVLVVSLLWSGDLRPEVAVAALGGTLAALALGGGQRQWAATRERQMDDVVRRAGEVAPLPAALPDATRSPSAEPRIDPALLDPEAEPEARRRADRRRIR